MGTAEELQPPRLATRSSGPTGVGSRSSAPDPTRSATCQRTPSTLRCSLRFASSASSSSGWRRRCSRDRISCLPAAAQATGRGEAQARSADGHYPITTRAGHWHRQAKAHNRQAGHDLFKLGVRWAAERLTHHRLRDPPRPTLCMRLPGAPAPATLRTAMPACGMPNK